MVGQVGMNRKTKDIVDRMFSMFFKDFKGTDSDKIYITSKIIDAVENNNLDWGDRESKYLESLFNNPPGVVDITKTAAIVSDYMSKVASKSSRFMSSDGDSLILYSDHTREHISDGRDKRTGIGKGSVFVDGVKDLIPDVVKNVKLRSSGSPVYSTKSNSDVGYDLVRPVHWIENSCNIVKETEGQKIDNGKPVKVRVIHVTDPIGKFKTKDLTLIIYNTDQILGDEERDEIVSDKQMEEDDIKSAIEEKKLYAVITAWSGSPSVPRASEWGKNFAIIIPDCKHETKKEDPYSARNILASLDVEKSIAHIIKYDLRWSTTNYTMVSSQEPDVEFDGEKVSVKLKLDCWDSDNDYVIYACDLDMVFILNEEGLLEEESFDSSWDGREPSRFDIMVSAYHTLNRDCDVEDTTRIIADRFNAMKEKEG